MNKSCSQSQSKARFLVHAEEEIIKDHLKESHNLRTLDEQALGQCKTTLFFSASVGIFYVCCHLFGIRVHWRNCSGPRAKLFCPVQKKHNKRNKRSINKSKITINNIQQDTKLKLHESM